MNSHLRLALTVALGAGMPLLSADCIGSSDPAIPGGDNSGFSFPDDGAGGSPGEDGTTEANGSLGMDGEAGLDAVADVPMDAPSETSVDAQADDGGGCGAVDAGCGVCCAGLTCYSGRCCQTTGPCASSADCCEPLAYCYMGVPGMEGSVGGCVVIIQ